jgi:hypothetical protein
VTVKNWSRDSVQLHVFSPTEYHKVIFGTPSVSLYERFADASTVLGIVFIVGV